jgi:predicted nucleic acid-binding protein
VDLALLRLVGPHLTIGKLVRSLMDCVIAAVAVRTAAVLVHQDRDFDVLASIAKDLRTWSH